MWDAPADGGGAGPCGWLRDRFGLWWRPVPERIGDWMSTADDSERRRVSVALLETGKLDVDALERAFDGDGAAA